MRRDVFTKAMGPFMPANAEEEGCGREERSRMMERMTAGRRRARQTRPTIWGLC
jgi:hypothetical protein